MNYFKEANNFYNRKDYINALSLYQKSVEVKQNEAASFYNWAVCLIKLKSYKKAIPLLKKALILKHDSRYFFNLAYCYTMLKDKRKALIYFNKAWSLNNDDKDCEKAINMIIKSYKKDTI
ncbi:tetratricopeptide repeat protein [Clostridium pasteurianum DSM 525 = ATCC 6013]|uniref:Tetratricopeptide repeat protein n=1 Tax=Clostridium pasteurianum DSM 525 = ATCC 6013 TaxID=1262449 RepID=A0A0H3J1G1_CLOPA|nr:CDC27 family protein [Clostridium pasteurianum]AJA47716.1 tetratricopeptide repeat protein [Clostridium pasteurianum DSM 525 = ATCC 6013]AJA51704.1 tetratricopeptide repeat protein [Clostridium pasteurianum DSM 525 = ATCC 6013]AOZ75016.1 hypothetical protein AQ983_07935 [Clostridium pasteurianum DSM 525 = ATCC 6013]AOZ78811.1 hypothetical protein AQ984_07925 [Clostridium pasteurianum]ELP59618.1 tpr repeats containing protein [Clostridium pasteurianum DSM 525 = ATCC 6013]